MRPSSEANGARRTALEAERARLTTEIESLTEAVADGEAMEPLLAAMKKRDRRRAEVVAELATLDRVGAMGDG